MTVPDVPRLAVDYPHTNDVQFGTTSALEPVPTLPPVVPEEAQDDRELAWNPPPPPPVYAQPRTGSLQFEYRPGAVRDDITAETLGFDEESQGSVGTSIQLLARGPQDYVLDINPQMTFFKQVYLRHTAFGEETCEDVLDVRPGAVNAVEIQRRGDMLGDVMWEVRLPNLGIPGGRWVDAIAYVLMARVRLTLDDIVVHDHERLWYDLCDRLFLEHGKAAALNRMIGRGVTLRTDAEHVVYLPFKFFCCTGHWGTRQFLPLASLQRQARLTLELTVPALEGCVELPPGASMPRVTFLKTRVLSDQMFVEQDEQRAAYALSTKMLVETAQDVDALSYDVASTTLNDVTTASLDLRELNLPVKSLVFVAYDENAVDNKRYFEYLDAVKSATLYLQSSPRFATRGGDYFSLVQTYSHAVRCSADRVGIYSFALSPAMHQPSGAVNFAAQDRPVLRVDLQNTAGRAVKIKAFAQCLNWLVFDKNSATYALV